MFEWNRPDCVAASDKDWRAPFRTGRRPGCAPGGAVTFFPAKESHQRTPALLSVSLRCASGNLRCSRRTGSRSTRTCGAQTDASPDPPAAALLGTATRARTSLRAIAALGPIKDIRVAIGRTAFPRPSAAKARVDVPALVDAPAAGYLRGGMRASARMLRCLARRGCSNVAAQQRSEFRGAPRKCPDAGCPVAQRRGRRQ